MSQCFYQVSSYYTHPLRNLSCTVKSGAVIYIPYGGSIGLYQTNCSNIGPLEMPSPANYPYCRNVQIVVYLMFRECNYCINHVTLVKCSVSAVHIPHFKSNELTDCPKMCYNAHVLLGILLWNKTSRGHTEKSIATRFYAFNCNLK